MRRETLPAGAVEAADAEKILRPLLSRVAFARATELARAGHYRDAEKVLAPAGGAPGPPLEALDLLARIRAQEGRLDEAEKLWGRALQAEPSNRTYQDALRRVAIVKGRRGVRRHHPAPLLAASLVIASLVIAALLWRGWREPSPVETKSGASVRPSQSPAEDAPQRPPAIPGPPARDTKTEIRLDVEGARQDGGSPPLLVTFDEGLFGDGATLRPDALRRLAELGEQLKPYADEIVIEVIGITDAVPVARGSRYRDNVALGLERARVVYEHLRTTTGLGPQALTISSRGDEREPEGGGDAAPTARARDHSVALRVTRRQGRVPPE
jgi:type VI secretion system protein ImpK